MAKARKNTRKSTASKAQTFRDGNARTDNQPSGTRATRQAIQAVRRRRSK